MLGVIIGTIFSDNFLVLIIIILDLMPRTLGIRSNIRSDATNSQYMKNLNVTELEKKL